MDKRVTFWLDGRDAEAIALLARRNGRSTGGELRQAVMVHLASSLTQTRPPARAGDVDAHSSSTGAERAPV